ncbi:alpha-glucosidase/alpha-galactosidase [Actinomadura sp. ATCC 31491]|uniref:Alpha-glucosidase/alpha-galactosidase n=1 Tax=Actinomadura luzonensis TaxID=2805427 RepID=A0ABT0G0G2_9ACTN|nr:alpha-glucosidase/alpha-galactosidase [Actinomadura luzonensis]MCK2218090.1 alpha-glucosidase/alpha-galactosidase [Actinomadura luzonensis]
MKIAFIGAGSVEFTQGLLADLVAFPDLGEFEVALHDIHPERLETAEAAARVIAAGRPVKISACPDLRRALEGADFAINMIQVGMIDATRVDFELPARHGLRQTIADTIGVGGIFRALRTFPALDRIGHAMAELCPDAWLLNYTNPMAMNVWYLAAATPVRNVVGLCHSIHWTAHDLAELVGVPYEEVSYLAAGVNHQSWMLRFEHRGENLYPRLDEAVARDPGLARRVRVDMYRRLGYYPTETSEHSSEYVPWYLHHDSEIERLRIPVGAYLGISEENVRQYEATRDALRAGRPITVEGTMEYAPQIIHSIATGAPRVVYGNLPNTGLITNLPAGAVVEVPCAVDALGVRPMAVGDLPPQCAALNRAYVGVNELTVRAATEGRRDHVRHAMMADPNTAATLTVERIDALCEDLLAAHAGLLPESLRESPRKSPR